MYLFDFHRYIYFLFGFEPFFYGTDLQTIMSPILGLIVRFSSVFYNNATHSGFWYVM